MGGGDHDAAGSGALANSVAEGGGGGDFFGEENGDAGGSYDLGAGVGEVAGEEAGVVADANAEGGLLGGVGRGSGAFGVEVGGYGGGGGADVFKGEVVGDDASPAVGAELDYWVRHACQPASVGELRGQCIAVGNGGVPQFGGAATTFLSKTVARENRLQRVGSGWRRC